MLQNVENSWSFSLDAPGVASRFRIKIARSAQDILNAQGLRHQVFAKEMGAQLNSEWANIDADRFDPHCLHLIVRDEVSGAVVGTYRILPPASAQAIGAYYAESEFDLSRFASFRDSLVEVGRSCVHPDYRKGTVIALLWAGLVDYMLHGKFAYLMGCASMSMADGGSTAVATFNHLKTLHMSPEEWRVVPHTPLDLETTATASAIKIPPLIRAYLRAGAYICGAPARDLSFNTADLLILLPMTRIGGRYFRHFVKR